MLPREYSEITAPWEAMALAAPAQPHPAHDGDLLRRQVPGHLPRSLQAVVRRAARPHHAYGKLVLRAHLAVHVQHRGRVVDLAETRRIGGVVPREHFQAPTAYLLQLAAE